MNIPKDPVILLSFINTKLRDFYPTLEDLCDSLDIDCSQIKKTLENIGYGYDIHKNQFISL